MNLEHLNILTLLFVVKKTLGELDRKINKGTRPEICQDMYGGGFAVESTGANDDRARRDSIRRTPWTCAESHMTTTNKLLIGKQSCQRKQYRGKSPKTLHKSAENKNPC